MAKNDMDPKLRMRLVEDILEGTTTQAAVAREHGVTRQAVSIWVKNAKEGKELRKRGRPRLNPGIFSHNDRKRIEKKIRYFPPALLEELDTDAQKWSPELVQELIKVTFELDHPIDHCADLLLRPESGLASNGPPSDGAEMETEVEMITEADLAPYIEKINEAQGKMKPLPRVPKRPPPSPNSKKKKKKQKKARRKNRKN